MSIQIFHHEVFPYKHRPRGDRHHWRVCRPPPPPSQPQPFQEGRTGRCLQLHDLRYVVHCARDWYGLNRGFRHKTVSNSIPTVYPDETTTQYVTHVDTSTSMQYVTATETDTTVAPTPEVTTMSTTGVYTIPAKTKTLTTTQYGAVPATTVLVPGTTTYGGITTTVPASSVVTYPYVTTETAEGTSTVKVYETVYTCPVAGTYTIGATTTTVPAGTTTTHTYASPTAYAPGTYVQPEITTTITETGYVVTCPYSTVGASTTPDVSSAVASIVPSVSEVLATATEAPTPELTTLSTTGVYTIPAKTTTLTETQFGAVPTTAVLTPGTTTYGGVTTIVETSTVVTCPYVATTTSEGTSTEVIYQTVYTCPVAGTYTIGATTTDVPATTTVSYASPTAYAPGTYVQPEITTTITETGYVVTCPYSSVDATLTSSVPAATITQAPATTTSADFVGGVVSDVVSKATEVASEVVSKATSVASAVVSKVSSAAAATSTAATSNGKYWAITYSPYDDDGSCKAASDVASDIADIASKGFSNVRVYSTDCDTLPNVGDACRAHGLGMIVGLFIKEGGISTCTDQLTALKAWNGWDMVQAVIVGNEAVFNGYVTAAELAAYIKTVKSELSSLYSGDISTSETVGIIQQNADVLCDVMDFVGVNIQPFFDGGVTAALAGTFLASQRLLAETACSGKTSYVLEAGWPSAGDTNGKAIASTAEQAIAIASYELVAAGHVTYFTYRNDLWKSAGEYNVEQHFGCGNLF
jgi:exo-beta-1,3-glucanase (GH17 family)